MNIVLIGTIGAGKTTVGKAISEISEFKFVDTDDVASELTMIELKEAQLNYFLYSRIFCRIEPEVLEEMAGKDGLVIATGALSVSHKHSVARLRENGVIIRLQSDVETVIARAKRENRSFLVAEGESYEEAIARDYRTYLGQYSDYDYSFNVSDEESPEECAHRILECVRNGFAR
ncbi:MAG: hypothetical protein LUG27_06790 [Clostridiales bacterium]|nr:hypothetical protein [Clostridiales bacterium]